VVGRGPTLPEAFEQVALGVFALLADPASVEERDAREVRAHGGAPETLLVNWLNECQYVVDVEGFVPRRVEFTIFALDTSAPGGEPLRLHCRLHGEDLDPARHIPRETVRGISKDDAAVLAVGDGFEARVFIQGGGSPNA
jgi:SHS2 domain-containing protein